MQSLRPHSSRWFVAFSFWFLKCGLKQALLPTIKQHESNLKKIIFSVFLCLLLLLLQILIKIISCQWSFLKLWQVNCVLYGNYGARANNSVKQHMFFFFPVLKYQTAAFSLYVGILYQGSTLFQWARVPQRCHTREFAVVTAGVRLCQQGCPAKSINSYLITKSFNYSISSDFSGFSMEALHKPWFFRNICPSVILIMLGKADFQGWCWASGSPSLSHTSHLRLLNPAWELSLTRPFPLQAKFIEETVLLTAWHQLQEWQTQATAPALDQDRQDLSHPSWKRSKNSYKGK